jgi:hypothetical protein
MPPNSSRVGRASFSCRSPPVKAKTIGLPPRSARTWIFVLNPPRLRPSAWAADPLLPRRRAGGRVPPRRPQRAASSRVRPPHRPLAAGQSVPVEDTRALPAAEAAVHRPPQSIRGRPVAPVCARRQPPEHPVHHPPVVVVRPFGRQERTQSRPSLIREFVPVHAPSLPLLCRHARATTAAGLLSRLLSASRLRSELVAM